MDNIHAYEEELTAHLFKKLGEIEGLRIYGPPPSLTGQGRASLAAFNVEGIHASDLATLLDHEGIAIRSGITVPNLYTAFLMLPAARGQVYIFIIPAKKSIALLSP